MLPVTADMMHSESLPCFGTAGTRKAFDMPFDLSACSAPDRYDLLGSPGAKMLQCCDCLTLAQALDNSGVKKESISSVEIVGSSSRVPALLQLMREVFDKEPSRTLNAKECVSRGCALNCAMLSPIFRCVPLSGLGRQELPEQGEYASEIRQIPAFLRGSWPAASGLVWCRWLVLGSLSLEASLQGRISFQ